jgi:hypothetical protein
MSEDEDWYFLEKQKRGALKYGDRWIEAMGHVRYLLRASDVRVSASIMADLAWAVCRASRLDVLDVACALIELGDQRLLASDGPAGGQPPDLSLEEWRTLYKMLDRARNGPLVP